MCERGTRVICDRAFWGGSFIRVINIPEGVKIIGEKAFMWCESLQTINISEGVTSIGEEAFYWCTSLESINLPESVTSIGDYAFGACHRLQSINIPEGVTSIGEGALPDNSYKSFFDVYLQAKNKEVRKKVLDMFSKKERRRIIFKSAIRRIREKFSRKK